MKTKYCINCGNVVEYDKDKSNGWVIYLNCSNEKCKTILHYKIEESSVVNIIEK